VTFSIISVLPSRNCIESVLPLSPFVKPIIVVGYPKSGCTWATRLVAELIRCPVAGFWGSNKQEIAVEGEDRPSDYRVYKSHHQLFELGFSPNDSNPRLIYVLRDPRDVALSGASYFHFDRFPRLIAFFRTLPRGEKLYRHTLHPLLVSREYRLEQMVEAVLHGSAAVHNWVRVSWREHWRPYQEAGVVMVRYEDLLDAPNEQCRRVLRYLELERSDSEIAAAIENQSFARKKQALLQQGETGRAKFMRAGQREQWRQHLPLPLQQRFVRELRPELEAWSYPL
jgi:hypothetical protein